MIRLFSILITLSLIVFSLEVTNIDNRSDINDIVVDYNGDSIFSVSDDGKIREWSIKRGKPIFSIKVADEVLKSIAISKNKRFLIFGGESGSLGLFSLMSKEVIRYFEGHFDSINRLIFDRSGKYFFSASDDTTVKMWEINSSKAVRSFEVGNGAKIEDIALSVDGKYLILATSSGEVEILDIKSGAIVKVLRGHRDKVLAVAVSHRGDYIVSGGEDNSIKIWDFRKKRLIKTLKAHNSSINSLTFSADDRYIISASGSFYGRVDNTIRVWSLKKKILYKTLRGHRDYINRVAILENGDYIISASDDETIRVWSIRGKRSKRFRLYKILEGQRSRVNSIDISSNGKYLLSGSSDGVIRLWDIDANRVIREYSGQNSPILSVAFSGNERYIVAGSGEVLGNLRYSIGVYNKKTNRLFRKFKSNRYIGSIDVSRSRYIVAGVQDSYDVWVWDIKRGSLALKLRGHIGQINSVAISSLGSYIVSGSDDTTIKLWSRASGKLLYTFRGHLDSVVGVRICNGYIISASKDKSIKVWSIKEKSLISSIKSSLLIDVLGVSEDGEYVAVASNRFDEDSVIEVWDMKTKSVIGRFFDKSRCVRSIVIDNKKGYIFSASGDTIKVWSLKSKINPIKEFVGGSNGNWIVFDYLEGRYFQKNRGDLY